MGNYRCMQILKCYYLQKNPDIIATVKLENGFSAMLFIPQNELKEYKERYGSRLNIWEWAIPKRRMAN